MTRSAEFALAAACCRWPRSAATRAAVRADAVDADWSRFGTLIGRHRIEGLAHAALADAGVRVGAPLEESLPRMAQEITVGALRRAAESVRLQAALDAAGLANLVLKGAALDGLAWGRIGLKRAWDIDLLVTPEDAPAARAVLESHGYDLADPAGADEATFATWVGLSKESAFVRRTDGSVAELHWRLVDSPGLLPTLSARGPARTVTLGAGLMIRTFAPDAHFAYLCVHGASHAWSRLKWLADLGALLAGEDEAGRARLFRAAKALGAGNCADLALLLCERWLDIPIPPDVVAETHSNRRAHRLLALALEALSGEVEIDRRPWLEDRIILSQLDFANGWRFRSKALAHLWVSVDDRMRARLPARLAFLYPLARGPFWLARRLRRRLRRP